MKDIIAQIFGIIGLIIIVLSFQCKKNRTFFLMQGSGSLMFSINFLLIGAWGGSLFNLCNLLRGTLFSRNPGKVWKLAVIEAAYALCFLFSVYLNPTPVQILLAAIPCTALLVNSVYMWRGNPIKIRYNQIFMASPAWIIHNIFNFSLGGLVCESFNIVSSIVYLIRLRWEKKRTASPENR